MSIKENLIEMNKHVTELAGKFDNHNRNVNAFANTKFGDKSEPCFDIKVYPATNSIQVSNVVYSCVEDEKAVRAITKAIQNILRDERDKLAVQIENCVKFTHENLQDMLFSPDGASK